MLSRSDNHSPTSSVRSRMSRITSITGPRIARMRSFAQSGIGPSKTSTAAFRASSRMSPTVSAMSIRSISMGGFGSRKICHLFGVPVA